jgi:alpha-L-fucosidase 2
VGVTARRDHGAEHPGWSKVWKACIFARLLQGEDAHRELAGVIAAKLHGNLWAVHPPFQIDCNFGYAAGVNEMLVQSHLQESGVRSSAVAEAMADGQVSGKTREEAEASPETRNLKPETYLVHLLPALPKVWAKGSVRGLRVRGGYEVDLEWKDGALTQAVVKAVADAPGSCLVRYGEGSSTFQLAKGESRTLRPGDFAGPSR